VALPQGWQLDRTRTERTSGQATVFPVLRRRNQRRYALKRLSNPRRRARFQREVQTMMRLRDQGVTVIPEVIAHDLETEKPYFVMPWYDESLADRIDRRAYTADLGAGIDVGIALAEALQGIHRHGYAHRDVKPDNVFFDGDTLLLGDFGLCLWADDDMRLTESAEAVGSRYFIAPENEGGINESADQQPADFYAFGKVLWCILAGRRPLPREEQLRPENRLARVLGNDDLARLDPLFHQLLDADVRSRLADSKTEFVSCRRYGPILLGRLRKAHEHRWMWRLSLPAGCRSCRRLNRSRGIVSGAMKLRDGCRCWPRMFR
jgi:serine/threonine protein kinase